MMRIQWIPKMIANNIKWWSIWWSQYSQMMMMIFWDVKTFSQRLTCNRRTWKEEGWREIQERIWSSLFELNVMMNNMNKGNPLSRYNQSTNKVIYSINLLLQCFFVFYSYCLPWASMQTLKMWYHFGSSRRFQAIIL